MDNSTASLEIALKSSTTVESARDRPNGSIISLIVGSLPIIILFAILLSFKICYRVCPQGQRTTEFHVPRRISTFSVMSRSSSVHHVVSSSSLHHPSHHQHHHGALRADGTYLAHIELETIKEPEEEIDSEDIPLTMRPQLRL